MKPSALHDLGSQPFGRERTVIKARPSCGQPSPSYKKKPNDVAAQQLPGAHSASACDMIKATMLPRSAPGCYATARP